MARSGVSVVFLFAVAQWLEVRTLERARQAIRALIDLSPREALVRRGGVERAVAVDDVRVGDEIIVRPGDKVPVDGVVVAGHERRQRSAAHRRVAAGRQGAGRRGVRRHASTAAARSRCA